MWKTPRSIDYKDLRSDGRPESDGDFRKSFATPTVAQIDGQPVLISQGAKAVYAYQPDNGKELWRVEERSSHSASSRPVYGLGLIFCQTGWSTGELLALRPGQPGEVIDANTPDAGRQLKVVWQSKRNVPRKPGLLWVNDLIFTMDDGGIASCLNALTGEAYWRERVGGNHSASPLAANGRVYFFSEEGTATGWGRTAPSRCWRKTGWRMVSWLPRQWRDGRCSCAREATSIAWRIQVNNWHGLVNYRHFVRAGTRS